MLNQIKRWLTARWIAKREREVAARPALRVAHPVHPPTSENRKVWAQLRSDLSRACAKVDS
jgi:hypothetical protein